MPKAKAGLAAIAVKKPVAAPAVSSPTSDEEKPVSEAGPRRAGAKPHISVYLSPEAFEQLTDLGYELRCKPRVLHREAFNLLFAKHGKPQIA